MISWKKAPSPHQGLVHSQCITIFEGSHNQDSDPSSPCPSSHSFICICIPSFFLEVSLVEALSRCLLQVTLPRLPCGRDFEDSLLSFRLVLRVFLLLAFPYHHSPTPTPVPLVSQTAGAFFQSSFSVLYQPTLSWGKWNSKES